MMDDLDKLLKESLTSIADQERQDGAASRAGAREAFVRRYRRRQLTLSLGAAAFAGAALVAALLFASGHGPLFGTSKTPVAGQQVIGDSIAVGAHPADVGTSQRQGIVWVANGDDGTVSRVDAGTERVLSTIHVGGTPGDIDVGRGAIWIANGSLGAIQRIDVSSGRYTKKIHVTAPSSTPMGVSIGEGAVWVVMRGSVLYRVDLTTRTVQRIPSVPAPVDVAARQGIVWVLDEQKGLVRLDARDGTITSPSIPVATRVGGDVYAAPGTVWIGNPATDTLIAFNAATNSFGAYFQLRGDYVDMAVLNSTVWVLTRDQQGNSLLTALDPRTGHELASPMSVDGHPVEITTDGHALWIAQRDNNALLRVDPTTVLNR